MSLKENLLKHLVEHLTDEDDTERKVIKTFPVKDKWKPLWGEVKNASKEGNALVDELFLARQKHATAKKLFWGTVETELGIFDKIMQYNEDTNEIEVLEEVEEKE